MCSCCYDSTTLKASTLCLFVLQTAGKKPGVDRGANLGMLSSGDPFARVIIHLRRCL